MVSGVSAPERYEKVMSFILRVFGAWLLGIMLILIVMDGTKSLAASRLVMTSIRDVWAIVQAHSLLPSDHMTGGGQTNPLIGMVLNAVLGWPAWAVAAVSGMACLILGIGKKKRTNPHRF